MLSQTIKNVCVAATLISSSFFAGQAIAGPKTKAPSQAEDTKWVAGSWNGVDAHRSGRTRLSLEITRDSIIVPTVGQKGHGRIRITAPGKRSVFARSGQEISLEAGQYQMDVFTRRGTSSKVGAYVAATDTVRVHPYADERGEISAYAVGINPELITSSAIHDAVGGQPRAAMMFLGLNCPQLVVYGPEGSVVMAPYGEACDEGTYIGHREGPTNEREYTVELPGLIDVLESHGLDPDALDLGDLEPQIPVEIGLEEMGIIVSNGVGELLRDMDELAQRITDGIGNSGRAGELVGAGTGALAGVGLTPVLGPAGGAVAGALLSEILSDLFSEIQDAINAGERDDDGDGVANRFDLDMDGDGVNNNRDPDMDGDGVPNEDDSHPRDRNRRILPGDGDCGPAYIWAFDLAFDDTEPPFLLNIDLMTSDFQNLDSIMESPLETR